MSTTAGLKCLCSDEVQVHRLEPGGKAMPLFFGGAALNALGNAYKR